MKKKIEFPQTRGQVIQKVHDQSRSTVNDQVAIEEPLEISIRYGSASSRKSVVIAVIMRTPGHDTELALGFAYSEQIVIRREDIVNVRYFDDPNRILLELRSEIIFLPDRFVRHIYTTSSCGICGKTAIEHIYALTNHVLPKNAPIVPYESITNWSTLLREGQPAFRSTGGMHGCALIPLADGEPIVFEDVGRHNALDKLVGHALNLGKLPLSNFALQLSGRASFELVQKAVMAGIPIVASVGAPSSMAIEMAQEANQTLLGFVRSSGFNIYSGGHRVQEFANKM